MDEREELEALRRLAELEAREKATAPEWNQLPGNILPSAGRFAGGLVDMIASPIQTLKGIGDLGAGALRAGVSKLSPSAAAYIDRYSDPETTQRIDQAATGAGNMLADRYGSIPALKKTLIQDPVGAAADLSTVFTGGAMMAPKAGTVANTLKTVAKYTDPLTPVVAGGKWAAPAVGNLASEVAGLYTGAGGDTVRGAYQAGREGGAAGNEFRRHMRGKGDFEQVLTDARAGLDTIGAERSAAYNKGMETVRASKADLDINPIVKAADDAVESVMFNGRPLVDDAEMAAITRARDAITQWASDFDHSPASFDALKRRLDAVTPDNPMHSQARRVISLMKTSVKDAVVKAVPEYREALNDYSASKGLTNEITRTLSLGPNAAADTGLRKLQSIGRNNVNTNFGNRTQLIRQLQEKGGVQLMPAIYGQNVSSWMPRGLQGVSAALQGVAGVAGMHPLAPVGMLAQSPRLIGEATHGLGRAVGGAERFVRDRGRWVTFPNSRAITPMQRLDALGEMEMERRKKEQQAQASRQNSAMGIR